MKTQLNCALGGGLALAAGWLPRFSQLAQAALASGWPGLRAASAPARVHTNTQFAFVAEAPWERVAPLFGADRERLWAPGWDPAFVWPELALDREGMVFQLAHGAKNAVWVNTCFDLAARRIQYVYFIPETMVAVITLRLTAQQRATQVEVTYERTALDAKANGLVRNMAAQDALAGPRWGRQINDHLASRS
jgi:hypothetical protein